MRLSDFIPPVVTSLARRVRGSSSPEEVIYPSYAAALRACGSAGYQEDAIVRVVFEKTVAYRDALANAPAISISSTEAYGMLSLAYRWARTADTEQKLHVVDFGGACGAHYFAFRKLLGNKVRLRWHVVETPAMQAMGRRLENEELRFFDNLDTAASEVGQTDLLYTSGAIQCVDDPYQVLRRMRYSQPRLMLFNRLALTLKDDDLVTVHKSMLSWNGIGALPAGFADREVRYPYTFLSRRRFEESLDGYRVAIEFDDQSGVHPVGTEPVVGFGRLYERS
jgi:putative methyltransferase (TIGR04325 family)